MNIPVIMYHSVNNYKDKHPQGFLAFDVEEFETHLNIFFRKGYKLKSLKEIFDMPEEELKTGKYAVLTFDDGFYDNLTVVSPILKKYNSNATVFVNTDMLFQTDRVDFYNWGFLNEKELINLHQEGVFDIQSHTHTHNRVFISNKVVDTYSEDKFDKYYWLIWLLFPYIKMQWHGDVRRFKGIIKEGFPILENDRAIVSKQYIINYEDALNSYDRSKGVVTKGSYESDLDYYERVKYLLEKPRINIQKLLNHKMEHICFPGGAYNEKVIKLVEQLGFKSYMLSSAEQNINTPTTFSITGYVVKVSRISFTLDYPNFLPKRLSSYISVLFKLNYYEGHELSIKLIKFLKIIRDRLRK